MCKRFIMLLGILLGSLVSSAAQTPAPQIILAQEHVVPIISMFRKISAPFPAASFPAHPDLVKSPAHFSHPIAGAYEPDHSVEFRPFVEEVKTLFITRSSLPLVQLWSGRLRLEGFATTLNMQNVELGPSGGGGLLDFRPPRIDYPRGPHSVDLYGVSMSFHFGRQARMGRQVETWRSLSRIVGSALK